MKHSRHTRMMLEAAMTPEEAVAFAEKWCAQRKGRRFTRRWRVEGSRAGNSSLVGWDLARRLFRQYGGKLVELVPAPPPRVTLKERAAIEKLPKCPRCEAEPGMPCRARWRHPDTGVVNGPERKPHAARTKLVKGTE